MSKDNTEMKIDRISFQLGMINCFAEMVAVGVKRLAISPPLTPDDHALIEGASQAIVQGFGIKSYLEKSLLVTDLQPEELPRGENRGKTYRAKPRPALFALRDLTAHPLVLIAAPASRRHTFLPGTSSSHIGGPTFSWRGASATAVGQNIRSGTRMSPLHFLGYCRRPPTLPWLQ
jgi:hypothetical protein